MFLAQKKRFLLISIMVLASFEHARSLSQHFKFIFSIRDIIVFNFKILEKRTKPTIKMYLPYRWFKVSCIRSILVYAETVRRIMALIFRSSHASIHLRINYPLIGLANGGLCNASWAHPLPCSGLFMPWFTGCRCNPIASPRRSECKMRNVCFTVLFHFEFSFEHLLRETSCFKHAYLYALGELSLALRKLVAFQLLRSFFDSHRIYT